MTRVSIQAYDSIEVDLWGHVFETRPVTRAIRRQIQAIERRLAEKGIEHAEREDELNRRARAIAEREERGEEVPAAEKTGLARERLELEEAFGADEEVALQGELLDLRLVPADGKRTKPSLLVQRKWEADELSEAQLDRLFEQLREAEDPS